MPSRGRRLRGIRIGCFRPPSTPDGTSRLRLTAHADHTGHDLDLACEVLAEVTGPSWLTRAR